MTSLRDYIGPGGRMLARRLDQLCTTLENLSVRLHSTIASAIGETISGIVRDTALHVLDDVTHCFPGSPAISQHQGKRFERDYYERDQRGYWSDDEEEDEYPRQIPDRSADAERLPTALAAGLQAASWWLRRWSGNRRLVTTFVIGICVTGVAFLGGPLAVALLTLAGSAAQITSLADIIGPEVSAYHRYDSA